MQEERLELSILIKEEDQTTYIYQSSHSTLRTLLEHRLEEYICMGLSIRLLALMIMAH